MASFPSVYTHTASWLQCMEILRQQMDEKHLDQDFHFPRLR